MDAQAPTSIAQEALSELKSWMDDRFDRQNAQAKTSSPCYHYTNAAGLKGILESEELWLTNVLHLNDPGEVSYGIVLAIDELKACISKENKRVQGLLGAAAEYVSSALAHVAFFVASFSADGDELNQWRAYGDNGRGYALGIDPKLLVQPPEEQTAEAGRIFVAPVIYDEAAARQRHRDVIEKFIEIFRRCSELQWADHLDDLKAFLEESHAVLALACRLNSIAMKHAAYKYEQETRIIRIGTRQELGPQIRTRVRGSELVPFVRMPMKLRAAGAISRIVMGPAAPELAGYGVESLLQSQGISEQTSIVRSTIRYRS